MSRLAGIPPDLGETEREFLERAFDALASVVQTEVVATSGTGDENSTAATEQPTGDYEVNKGVQQALARRQQQQHEQPGQTSGGGDGGDKTPKTDAIKAPRILPREIIRLLRAGAVEEYRRASPALSAACIYQEFAEGLEDAAAARGKHEHTGRSAEEDDQTAGDRRANEVETPRRHGRAGGGNIGSDGQGWGISKEEFCDYFEAVTDLVDLNGLSLVSPVNQSLAQPAAVSV